MKELLRFKDKTTEYYVYLKKSSIVMAKQEDGKETYDLTKEEKELVSFVLGKLFLGYNSRYLGLINYQKNEYHHFYDLNNDWHYFYTLEGDIPEVKTFIDLNYRYNNMEEYVAIEEKSNKKDKRFLKRLLTFGEKTLIVIISLEVLFIATHFKDFINNVKFYYIEPAKAKIVEVEKKNDLTVNEVLEIIENNDNLTLEEKKNLMQYTDFFTDKLPYVDQDDLVDSLTNMKINYYEDQEGIIRGSWHPAGFDMYNIKIFDSVSTKEHLDESDYSVLRHEFFHTFTKKSNRNCLGNGFYEFTNRVFANEYNYDEYYDGSYHFLESCGYLFLELFDSEAVKEFHAQGDYKVLAEQLYKIIPDSSKAINALSKMDTLNTLYFDLNTEENEEKKEEMVNEFNEIKLSLKNDLRVYYEAKYQKDITSNLYDYYLYNPDEAINEYKELHPEVNIVNLDIDRFKIHLNERKHLGEYSMLAIYRDEENVKHAYYIPIEEIEKEMSR